MAKKLDLPFDFLNQAKKNREVALRYLRCKLSYMRRIKVDDQRIRRYEWEMQLRIRGQWINLKAISEKTFTREATNDALARLGERPVE